MTKLTKNQQNNLSLGYCCINVSLRDLGILCSRTCRLQTIKEKGIEHAYKLAMSNLEDLASVIRWNHRNKIRLYRMSSEMFPFASHPSYYKNFNLNQFAPILKQLGNMAKQFHQTLTFHPGQFNQLTSHRQSVIENTIIELNLHAQILDMMDAGPDSVIVIHGGSKNGGKDVSLKRFKENFAKLSKSAQQRLVLENCEMAYSIEDLLPISEELGIPIVVDTHHHAINPGTKPLKVLIQDVLSIWRKRNITPLFHVSESKPGVSITDNITKRRAHSDFVQVIPVEILEVVEHTPLNLDVEAKMKDKAVAHLRFMYDITIS